MIDRAEGSPSVDGDRYAWIVYNGNEDIVGVVSYDLGTDTVLGTLPLSQFSSRAGPLDPGNML
jgi:hypothetical protein